MHKKSIILATLVFVLGILVLFFFLRRSPYQIVNPHKGDLTEAVYGLGKVKSKSRYEVIVGVISTVRERFVNEGDLVEKGAPLIKTEEQATFRAPFRGTVTFVGHYEGETAVPSVPILRLEDLSNCEIELSLEQQSILRVKVGQPAKISFESLRGKILPGKVTAIFPREDEFLTRIAVEGLDATILPGMTADVTIEIGTIHDATLVPLAAVQNGMVNVRREGRWQKIKVDVGHIDGLSAEIKNGTLTTQDEIRFRAGQ